MESKERPVQNNLGVVRRENFSPSGDFPLPWALKRAEELEKRKTFGRMAVSGIFATIGTAASCAHPIFIGPTIVFYAEFVRNFRKVEDLEK